MENLVKQMRVRFSGEQDSQEALSTSKDRRLQKTQSFKGGRKTQNWFRRQFSGQMRQDNDLGDNGEFATAVAAVAFAINSLDEAVSHPPKKTTERTESSLNRNKSRKEDGLTGLSEPGRVSRRFSGKEAIFGPGDASMRKSEVADQSMPEGAVRSPKMPQKAASKIPSIKKTPTFADGHQKDKDITKLGTKVDMRPPVNRTFSRSGSGKQKNAITVGDGETKADAWERAEMARINKKFEKMTSTIATWENEKKTKAERHMDKRQSEMERRRAISLQRYREEISRIDQIAGGARAAAEEKRRNEETKAKAKANKIRSTGKAPATCSCF